MSDTRTIVKEPPQSKKGLFGSTVEMFFKMFGLLIFSLFVSIIIEWVGMYFYYPDAGYRHAEMLMQKEMSYLQGSASGNGQNNQFINSATQKVSLIIDTIFIKSGALESIEKLKEKNSSDGKIVTTFKAVAALGYDFIMASVFIICMFLVRLTILILSLPIFVLFGLVGMSDGLMQRDLRRWCGGRESGYIYHWAKKFSFPTLMLVWFIYLSIPNSVHPNYIILPGAILFGMVLMVMSSKFKKYL